MFNNKYFTPAHISSPVGLICLGGSTNPKSPSSLNSNAQLYSAPAMS